MTDIYDIQLDYFKFVYNKEYFIWVFIFIFFYFLANILFKNKKNLTQKNEKKIKNNLQNKKNLEKKLIFLEKNFEYFSNKKFFKYFFELLQGIIFYNTQNKNIYKMSFEEFNKQINTPYKNIYKKIYFWLFNPNSSYSLTEKEILIKEVKKVYFNSK